MNKIKVNCSKCSGTGYLLHYANIKNGTCFQCNGVGYKLLTENQYKKQLEEIKNNENKVKEYYEMEREEAEEYRREQLKKEEQKQQNIKQYQNKLQYYGNIGEKINLTLSLKTDKWINSKWGSSKLYILTDNNNHTFSFFTNYPFIVLDTNKIEISATIKAHKEINGYKQTELKNVKVLNHIEISELTDEEIEALPF